MQKLTFKNEDTIPQLGLGTWKSKPGEVYKAVRTALSLGYRHFDCAFAYGNESEIGEAFRDAMTASDLRREDIFVTSKLWNTHHRAADVPENLKASLKDLQLDYLDLYLIHWPVCIKKGASFPVKASEMISISKIPLAETWRAMADCRARGMTRHIGVSNFAIPHLNELIREGTAVPEMNQVESHPYLSQKELLAFCKDHDILMTAYSPLGSADRSAALKGKNEPPILEDPVLIRIAEEHDCSPAQVILAWHIHRGICVIPKSVNEQRMKENLDSVDIDLSEAAVNEINGLNRNFRFIDESIWTPEGGPYTRKYLWGEE